MDSNPKARPSYGRKSISSASLPLPKDAANSVRDATVEDVREKPPAAFSRALTKTLRNLGTDITEDYSHIFAALQDRFAKRFENCSVVEAFAQVDNIFTSILDANPSFAATIPIACQNHVSGNTELIASGVLVKIVDRHFLFTAAHVINRIGKDILLIPGREGFMSVEGVRSATRPPAHGCHLDDKLDIGFVCLNRECVSKLDPRCRALGLFEVSLESEPPRRTTYTVAGYPWRKGRVKKQSIETGFTTLSGVEAKAGEYEELGLSPSHHIVIRFHKKRVFSSRLKRVITSPLPSGMSGGGIYAWSEAALREWPVRLPLVGIINEFIPDKSVLIGTRLCNYVRYVFQKQPDLAAIATGWT